MVHPSEVSPKIRVLFVDDSPDITAALGGCIDHEPDMESAGSLASADDLASEIRTRRADVVLIDMTMPGRKPLEALREVKKARVIVFSGRSDQEAIESAAEAGASGFLSKSAEVPVILAAVREVAGRNAGDTGFAVWR